MAVDPGAHHDRRFRATRDVREAIRRIDGALKQEGDVAIIGAAAMRRLGLQPAILGDECRAFRLNISFSSTTDEYRIYRS